MIHVDAMVLNLTEWYCRRFQLLTGKTNIWLAVQLTNLSIVMYFVWAGMYFWSRGVAPRIIVTLFCGGLLYVLSQTIFKVSIEAYEKNAYLRVAKGLRNPRRVRDAPLRISFLTLSILLCYPVLFVYLSLRLQIVLLTYSLILLTTVVLYLLACDPLSPSAGRLNAWLRLIRAEGERTIEPVEHLSEVTRAPATCHVCFRLPDFGCRPARLADTPGAGASDTTSGGSALACSGQFRRTVNGVERTSSRGRRIRTADHQV
jgi:hypothetical protein